MLSPFKRQIKVPPFQQYMDSEENMNRDQRRFFGDWVKHWNGGCPLDVQGNISYLFCFVFKVLAMPPSRAVPHLTRLLEAYPQEEKFLEYCQAWLSDCYVLLGDYHNALRVYPPIPISTRGATCTDDILSLKLQVGEHIAGRDVLTLNGPKVTKWGNEHLEDVSAYLDVVISAHERHNGLNLLEEWKSSSHQYPYSVFRGTFLSSAGNVPCFSFSRNEEVVRFVREKTRDAENSVREEMNIPRVGEGWVSETELYYEIKDALSETQVLQHASPDWLGRQHLDIFIPDYAVALEYQGAQHDQPVEYFGGEKAYQATKRRDAKKKRMCTKNGIRFIEVRSGYELKLLVQTIRQSENVQGEHPTKSGEGVPMKSEVKTKSPCSKRIHGQTHK